MTSNQHGPLMSRATQALQWSAQWVAKRQRGANPIKADLSSDWGLQFDPMKPESLVIADQLAAVNTFSSFVLTARHVREVGNAGNSRVTGTESKIGDQNEVVTRHP